ncbi:MAG: phosphotransferase system enzyme I (PtsP) [Maritalea sp.]|jgi:phosphotransferase system enzyme I (PtsP)
MEIQDRLNQIVELIADSMHADVCSFYVLRDDGQLELFATQGLKREAVHKTTLLLGEGLVGLIAAEAQSLNLADAPSHPAFAYRPETGEDPYHSFLGVPVLRSGQTLGVLDVQSRAGREFSDAETEALLTTATLLAEMVSTAEFGALVGTGSNIELRRPRTFEAASFSDGIALGKVFIHDPRVVVTNFVAEDVDAETERLERAVRTMRMSIDDMFNQRDMQARSEHREILESYRMFAHDRGWLRRLREAVASGLTAEAAVERVQNDTRARMMRQTDPYIRDRLHDLDDLANRLLRVLTGDTKVFGRHELPENAVLVARNMGPAELLEYDRTKLKGVALEEGGMTAHVAIVARSLGITVMGQADNITSICETGDNIILDAQTGTIHLRPTEDVAATYVDKVRLSAKRQERFAALKDKPSVTLDGVAITLLHNSGLLADMSAIEETGAAGIGLFRTELQFMIASKLPRLAEQVELYGQAMDLAGNRPIVFRLLDIGGDKVVAYLRSATEENPAMGWRSLRLGLDRPALLRTQIRALLQAANGRPLDILVPMVTDCREFVEAKQMVNVELKRLHNSNFAAPCELRIGAMIEVPSLLFELDQLLPLTDFVSIGSNDLVQFLTAADRANARVARRYDAISPPRLRAFKHIADAARRYQKPLTMCGELAGRPIEALALMAVGIERLSMAASSVGQIKELVLSLDLMQIRAQLTDALDNDQGDLDIREFLYALADRQGLPL